MANIITWNVVVDGKEYNITLNRKGKATLDINGEIIPVAINSLRASAGYDEPFMIGNKEARLVVFGSKVDISIDGVYVNSKKAYYPIKKATWYSWIFIIACLAIPVVAIGGVVPVLLGVIGAILCRRVAIQPKLSTVLQLILQIIITGIAWGIFYFFTQLMIYLTKQL